MGPLSVAMRIIQGRMSSWMGIAQLLQSVGNCQPSAWLRGFILWRLSILRCASQAPLSPTRSRPPVSAAYLPNDRARFIIEAWNTIDLERLTQLRQRRTQVQVIPSVLLGWVTSSKSVFPQGMSPRNLWCALHGGTSMLPLIGTLQETGFTEDQLRESLRRRLGRDMYTPQFAFYGRE